jgi:peptide/nickel transport system substrate-binding protein
MNRTSRGAAPQEGALPTTPTEEGIVSGRTITRRRFFQAAGGMGVSVLYLANGHKIVAQTGSPTEFAEAPQLAELVGSGDLPPVEERLPSEPMVVEPTESIGQYGGILQTALLGGGANTDMLDRYIGYEHLLRWSTDWNEVIPNIASGFEVNADSTAYTFTLRPGTKWSDGEPFTADDILFYAEDVATDPDLGATPSNPYTVEKNDDHSFTITFERPDGLFAKNMCTWSGAEWTLYPRHYLSQFHQKYNTTNLDDLIAENDADDWVHLFQLKGGTVPGTPYNALWQNADLPRLHAWRLVEPYGEGTRVTFERNPYYFKVDPEGNQLPYLDGVNFEVTQDEEVLLLKATAGEMDMLQRTVCTIRNKPVLAESQESGGYNFFEAVPSIMNTNIYQLNLTHKNEAIREIFQNRDFRIGLSYAINRQEVIDTVYVSQGEPWQAAPLPSTPYYNETLAKQYTEYDVDKANEHLDKVLPDKDGDGWRLRPDGERLSFVMEIASGGEFPEMVDAADLVVNRWREVGVDASMRPVERSLRDTRVAANDHDASAWPGGSGLQDALFNPYLYMPYGYNFWGRAWTYWWRPNPTAGAEPMEPPEPIKQQFALYDELSQSPDPDEQTRLMNEILKIAQEEFWVIGVGTPAVVYGIRTNTLRNVPDSMPEATVYPTPGPTNPEQYYFEG